MKVWLVWETNDIDYTTLISVHKKEKDAVDKVSYTNKLRKVWQDKFFYTEEEVLSGK